ncbi:MAG: DivIVA domain-containing protein [Oscillospiraceae bacterium]|jgi:hypothetical protein|nr:DivIVA domain-containing protein [Oscillospiraceae bacterium]
MDFLVESKKGGYNREQVDAYIEKIRAAYQELYQQYQAQEAEIQELRTRCARLENEPRRNEAPQDAAEYQAKLLAVGQALVDAQLMRQQILEQAKYEAQRLRGGNAFGSPTPPPPYAQAPAPAPMPMPMPAPQPQPRPSAEPWENAAQWNRAAAQNRDLGYTAGTEGYGAATGKPRY